MHVSYLRQATAWIRTGERIFPARLRPLGNAPAAFPDMTNTRRATSRVGAALVVAVAGVAVTHGTSSADPAGHQVTYTVTAQDSLMANISYINTDPPSMAAYNADSSKYLNSVHTPIAPGGPLVYTTTLADPNQWALVTASGGLRVKPQFHCEIAVDGQVVVRQDGGSGVTCSTRPR